MSWQQKQQKFISATFKEHRVGNNEEAWKFYPVSLNLTFKLKDLAASLGKILATVLAKNGDDHGTISRKVKDAEGGVDEFRTEATPSALAELRHKHRTESVHSAVNELMSTGTKQVLCEIIMDSLRDIFPRKSPDNPPSEEFAATLDTTIFIDCLIGVAKANAGVFGPLLRAVGTDEQTLIDKAAKKVTDSLTGLKAQ